MDKDWLARYRRLEAGDYPPDRAVYDEAEPVRWRALTLGVSDSIARHLAHDPSVAVRVTLAGRTRLDGEAMLDLAYDADARVRRALACRTDLSDEARARLAQDTDPDVLDALGDMERAMIVRLMPAPPTPPAPPSDWRTRLGLRPGA